MSNFLSANSLKMYVGYTHTHAHSCTSTTSIYQVSTTRQNAGGADTVTKGAASGVRLPKFTPCLIIDSYIGSVKFLSL